MGHGRDHPSARGADFYLPRGTPYLPRGTLREVLAYPLKPESFGANAYTRALYRLGVERLALMLDETHRSGSGAEPGRAAVPGVARAS